MIAPLENCPESPIGRHGMRIAAGTVIEDGFVFICEFCLRTWIMEMDKDTRCLMPRAGLICPGQERTP